MTARKTRTDLRRRGGTQSGGLLKTPSPTCADNWNITRLGFREADTVVRYGDILEWDLVWSVTYRDISSDWTFNRVLWTKGATGVVDATEELEWALLLNVAELVKPINAL